MSTRPIRFVGQDLLRIKCNVLVLCLHMTQRIILKWPKFPPQDALGLVFNLFHVLSPMSVVSLIGISGFCGVRGKSLNVRRVFVLWLQIWFYYLFGCIVHRAHGFKAKIFGLGLCPQESWYIPVYFRFITIQPGINLFVQSLSKIEYMCLCLCIFIYKILYFIRWKSFFWKWDTDGYDGETVSHMSMVYMIMGFFGLHGNPLPKILTPLATIGCYYVGLLSFSGLFPRWMRILSPWLRRALTEPVKYCSPFWIICSMFRVLSFHLIPIDGRSQLGRSICFIAERAFAIFLFHGHYAYVMSKLCFIWLRFQFFQRSGRMQKYKHLYKSALTVSVGSVAFDTFRCFLSDVILMVLDWLSRILMCKASFSSLRRKNFLRLGYVL
jgi:hypothetical protein